MGAFVLGILVGWLLEWLFFTYWIKGRSTGRFADCSGLKTELNTKLSTKNGEISALKAELDRVNASISEGKKLDVATEVTKKSSKEVNEKAASSPSATSSKKSVNKTVAKKAPKKAQAKKTATKPATKKKVSTKKSKSSKGDDLTKLSGIGFSMSAKLNELGISTFQKLSEMDDDILRDMLEASGARLNNNKEAMDTWNEQAALAAKGDFEGLKELQESLKS